MQCFRKQNRDSYGHCGACGYCVAHLSSLTCPECGGDLRLVGIRGKRTPARVVVLGIGSLLYWPFWLVIWPHAAWWTLPHQQRFDIWYKWYQPPSNTYSSIVVEGHSDDLVWLWTKADPCVKDLSLEIADATGHVLGNSLRIDVIAWMCWDASSDDPSLRQRQSLTASRLEDWISCVTKNAVTRPEYAEELCTVFNTISHLRNGVVFEPEKGPYGRYSWLPYTVTKNPWSWSVPLGWMVGASVWWVWLHTLARSRVSW